MRKLTHPEILSLRSQNKLLPRTPISFCLNDVRSLYNVGSIFRLADGIRAERIYLCGITGQPSDEGRIRLSKSAKAIAKTALGAEQFVPWEHHLKIVPLLKHLKSSGYHIAVMEHTTQSRVYTDTNPAFPVCLVVGNEVCGVDSEIIALADDVIDIPMLGEKNSLNVSVATGIVAYEWLHQYQSNRGVRPSWV